MTLPGDWSDWKTWAILIAVIILLYIARPHLQRTFRSLFMGLAYMLNRLALWFGTAAANMYAKYCETVAAHLADEYQDKLYSHEARLGARSNKHDREILHVVGKLETSSQEIEGSVETLKQINLPQTTLDAVRMSLAETVNAKSQARLTSAMNQVKRTVSAEIQTVRPDLQNIRSHLKPIGENVVKLKTYGQEFARLADRINSDFDVFEESIHSDDRVAVAQKQSILIPLLIALIVMFVALTGAFLNFFLIARPMAEIVGDGLQILGMPLPTAAALVVIFLEAVAGIVLMEAAGVTKLGFFLTIGVAGRRILFWAAFAFLCGFSFFEAILAMQRDSLIILDQQTQVMALGDLVVEEPAGVSLIMIAQIMLAVVIPWLLAIAAIPLETVVKNSVFLLRIVGHVILVFLSNFFRLLSTVVKSVGLFLLRLYDLIIFLPLAIEQVVQTVRHAGKAGKPDEART
ncbi:hypothetical protein [Hyphomonas johnsonii]|uniref:Transmembrane protein n=1 Tax=Hyphomonas johnsonii MHS-2 TaxID=1280950 RepID=A0A059FMH8_9PROT|nr:hypothetical protein [Hyphomonas johnsonii]KCZ91812.1 hypothetical protein HJO_11862 [Hyphomonas johnsonii MHS-2]